MPDFDVLDIEIAKRKKLHDEKIAEHKAKMDKCKKDVENVKQKVKQELARAKK